ncbi:MAG TPA: UDP-3-O-(3-hydroxymyristoyl)glucosamine N-acyltransferase [Bacteroidetes bacterium]|nr:UDP-3-O-(3-hydroxymyristoyl)glucosamine N-acyltransferase [Bacteroidota bacterium]
MSATFPMSVAQIAELLGRTAGGGASLLITGVNTIELAGPHEISFVGSDAFARHLPTSQAGCLIVRSQDEPAVRSSAWIVSPAPYQDMVVLMRLVNPEYTLSAGLRHATAVVDPSAVIDETASIGPGCVVSAGCVIGPGTQLLANVVLYPNVTIGSDCVLHAGVTCYQGTVMANRCVVHACSVIGSDGFGYVEHDDKHFEKIPHVGTVSIGSDVEIGSNVSIDRAAMGQTVIGDRVKIDNLVQLAHGVVIGEDTAIAAQVAIAGGTRVGRRNRIAGQAGIVGHVVTADDVVVYAQSGVAQSIERPGAYFGSPAKEHGLALRIDVALRQLPELLRQVRTLTAQVDELKQERGS